MDFVQALDTSKLVLFGTGLSFVMSPFTAPTYNLPIYLFGTYAQENQESTNSLQTFTGLVAGSILWDIIYMSRHEQNGFIRFLTVILLILKIPTFLSFSVAVRQRGVQFGGLGAIRSGDFIWSMPGGFTSTGRDGYQNMDEEAGLPAHPAPAPAPVRHQAPPPALAAAQPPPPATVPYQAAP
ncbi:hypothetical protein CYLTODRAFT_355296 [Cylindrobasidium torrendii FP15055 ss-10]|uniref:Uncharacterized protein n=1 Tax=Cylindrobasidium torrendii FP15055 ss-10 TaxID=1314674 RepID=A0A0D7B7R7_9AGAR|nr:hypothetical protein CYLTODRAFT_355296 [Cylindrobasidium torrendii FP15055 ss-10]